MTTTNPLHRKGFSSLRSGGLNWDALPSRLFDRGNRKFWNPRNVDFSQDPEDSAQPLSAFGDFVR
jgi:ribonucleoside-diphosphate reductase beta chain